MRQEQLLPLHPALLDLAEHVAADGAVHRAEDAVVLLLLHREVGAQDLLERILLGRLLERVVGRVLVDRLDERRLPGQLLDLVVGLRDAGSAQGRHLLLGSVRAGIAHAAHRTASAGDEARRGSWPRSRTSRESAHGWNRRADPVSRRLAGDVEQRLRERARARRRRRAATSTCPSAARKRAAGVEDRGGQAAEVLAELLALGGQTACGGPRAARRAARSRPRDRRVGVNARSPRRDVALDGVLGRRARARPCRARARARCRRSPGRGPGSAACPGGRARRPRACARRATTPR